MNVLILSHILTPQATKQQATPVEDAKLKSVCQDFESVFFGMMLKEMRKTVPTDPLLGDDAHQQEIYQGMMDDAVAKQMATHNGSDSLAMEMYRQLSKAQNPPAAAASAGTLI
jgi:flagellar protein FlgJ